MARTVRMPWTVLVHQDPKDKSYYWATVKELPGLVTQGDTMEELKKNVADAIECHLTGMAESISDHSGPVIKTLEAEVLVR
jgi:predicted RNase H-like HicB family nuclease